MTVYVDAPVHTFGRMVMCHMVSPSLDELHAMAEMIGVQRKWFQDPRKPKISVPHYDVAKSKRALAVAAGAKEIDKYQMSVISKVALNRFYELLGIGIHTDPVGLFRRIDSDRLPALEAWLAQELAG